MYRIVAENIALHDLDHVVRESDGGVVRFLGIVRPDAHDGRAVSALWYEAYERMALDEFAQIAREAHERFGDVRVAIVHRIGEVQAGEIAVAVLAAAGHRDAAFEACRYTIDQLKHRAPIWKKELYAAGGSEWRATGA